MIFMSESIEFPRKPLGSYIRELRIAKGLSIRMFAQRLQQISGANISPAFMSDLENGRRFPSDKMFTCIANALEVEEEDLRNCDPRIPTQELNDLASMNSQYGFAFRKAVNIILEHDISPQDLLNRILNKNN